ncbi:MAG: class I SAM-dependent methyltransferase [Candidatus Aenigmatarchaeota archaeon]
MTYWSGIWKGMEGIEFSGETFMWKYYKLLLDGYRFRGKRVLEIGCGTGINSIIMARLGARVTFLDSSPEALGIVRKTMERFGVKGRLVCQDGLELKARNEFDLVHSEGVVEHFKGPERQQILDIHARAARKGGKVVIIVPNAKCPGYRLGKGLAELTRTWVHGAEWPYTGTELLERMARAGLRAGPVIGGEFLFSLGWAFAPLWLKTGDVLERSIRARAQDSMVRLNYNNFFANRWGRVIGAVGVKK